MTERRILVTIRSFLFPNHASRIFSLPRSASKVLSSFSSSHQPNSLSILRPVSDPILSVLLSQLSLFKTISQNFLESPSIKRHVYLFYSPFQNPLPTPILNQATPMIFPVFPFGTVLSQFQVFFSSPVSRVTPPFWGQPVNFNLGREFQHFLPSLCLFSPNSVTKALHCVWPSASLDVIIPPFIDQVLWTFHFQSFSFSLTSSAHIYLMVQMSHLIFHFIEFSFLFVLLIHFGIFMKRTLFSNIFWPQLKSTVLRKSLEWNIFTKSSCICFLSKSTFDL